MSQMLATCNLLEFFILMLIDTTEVTSDKLCSCYVIMDGNV